MNALIERYNRPAPRYTSYPPAPHWKSAGGALLHYALHNSSRPLSLYFHIPFCERLCLYCGCNVVVKKDHGVAIPYIEWLQREMSLCGEAHGRPVTQMHWGGGTPTYLEPKQIQELFNAIVSRFAVSKYAEISIEIDPRVTSIEHLQVLRSLGFNRLSVGIQDFDPQVQQAVRRIQSFESTRQLFAEARRLQFESINVDLIYGLPFQNRYSFRHTLELIRRLEADRIAVFSYAHVPSLKKQQKALEKHLPSDQEKFDLFLTAIDYLTTAGYDFIGLDHFAKPNDPLSQAWKDGTLHRNFQGYSTHADTDLLGFGVSSISHIGDVFLQNHRELADYANSVIQGNVPVARGYVLTEDDRIRAAVIEKILCHASLSKSEIEDQFGIVFDRYFDSELQRLKEFEHDRLLAGVQTRVITILKTGRLFIRSVAQVFDAFQPAAVAAKAV